MASRIVLQSDWSAHRRERSGEAFTASSDAGREGVALGHRGGGTTTSDSWYTNCCPDEVHVWYAIAASCLSSDADAPAISHRAHPRNSATSGSLSSHAVWLNSVTSARVPTDHQAPAKDARNFHLHARSKLKQDFIMFKTPPVRSKHSLPSFKNDLDTQKLYEESAKLVHSTEAYEHMLRCQS